MFDFYEIFRIDGNIDLLPSIKIDIKSTDKYEKFKLDNNLTTLSYLADKYYNDVRLFPLILFANPQFKNEIEIPNGFILRIPFPLQTTLNEVREKYERFRTLNI